MESILSLFDIDDSHLTRTRRRGSIYCGKITFDSRLETFRDWPISMTHKPNDLAKASYFYTGRGDIIKSLQCKPNTIWNLFWQMYSNLI